MAAMTELEPPQEGDYIVTVSLGDGENDRLDLHNGDPSHIDLHISQVRHV